MEIMELLRGVLKAAVEGGASDVHIKVGAPFVLRINRQLLAIEAPQPTEAWMNGVVEKIVPPHARKRLEEDREVDFSYLEPGVGRFRTNIFQQKGSFALAMRYVKTQVPSFEDLGLLPVLKDIASTHRGIVLVAGTTGSGKSTTLAAMIDEINTKVNGHILTIEDPIEFVHSRKRCLISQREIGVHSPSFAAALHSALREDPDVILVGEMRDLETVSIAVTAAEMGILVMGTLHTNGAGQTIDRIVNSFPTDKQAHVRTMLSTSLRGVISQQLVARKGEPGLVAALEIMVNTPAVSNLIRQGKLDQLETAIQGGARIGMRTMDSALKDLLDQGRITGKTAYESALEKRKFEDVKELA